MADDETPPAVPAREFLAGIQHRRRRADGERLLQLMHRITGEEPVMWGSTMIGFGSYHYRYASGREGDALAVGFSPRSASLSLYGLTFAPGAQGLLETLGKHRTGAACLYVNKLDDVDLAVLEQLIVLGHEYMKTEFHTHSDG